MSGAPERVARAGAGRRRLFHRYLAAHSLLIGLLPFFVPVYLWELGLPLGGLCLLIGVSGVAFSAALVLWQRLARTRSLATLTGLTFAFELALVAAVVLCGTLLGAVGAVGAESIGAEAAQAARGDGAVSLPPSVWPAAAFAVGIANGVYNAFYWTTQRALFAALGTERDSGRRYGNLQIIVAGFLKVGILAGGLLIDAGALHWVLLLSALVGLVATAALVADAGRAPLHDEPAVTLRAALGHRDRHGSRRPFAIDGLFLYLESHFWTLSLFLLVREDHSRLGVVVIVLGIVFALLFLLVKNRIDRPGAADAVYRASVALYALSWLLRLAVDTETPQSVTLALLVAITFCSSLFRLAFNKRFFDIARNGTGTTTSDAALASSTGTDAGAADATGRLAGPVGYLVVKSHLSQLAMAAVFLPLAALVLALDVPPGQLLAICYAVAALLSLGYLGYRRPRPSGDRRALPAVPTDPAPR